MRRILFLALLAASLLPFPGPVHAQATADQLNKLSLEALTARPSGGSASGYTPRATRPTYSRSYRQPTYARSRYYHARRYAPARRGYHRSAPSYRRYAPRRSDSYARPAPRPHAYRPPAYHRSYRR